MKFVERLAARVENARATKPALAVCLGDSVTHGCFEVFLNERGTVDTVYDPERGYPALLQRALRSLYPAAAPTVLNAGISGDSAAGGLARVERDALSFNPELVTLAFGLNDSMNADIDAGLARYGEALRGMLERVLASGAEAIVVTPSFMCEYVPHVLSEQSLRDIAARAAKVQTGGILARYAERAREEAARLRVPVADAYARWEDLHRAGVDTTALLANGINHPSAAMHSLFAEEIMRALFA